MAAGIAPEGWQGPFIDQLPARIHMAPHRRAVRRYALDRHAIGVPAANGA